MTNNIQVSVIIAFLNPGNWLVEAIESVCAQTFQDWEIILVDDGSVESDSAIALRYTQQFPGKILCVEHANHINKGLTASRNVGIQKARGECIAFLDADDCWLPSKLQRQLDLFAAMPDVQMICEASLFWYTWNDRAATDYVQLIGVPEASYQPSELIPLLYPFGEGQPPCPSGIMIRTDALKCNHGFEEAFSGVYQLYEDQAFLFKMYCNEIVYISGDLNNKYRKRHDSMSSAANDPEIYKKVRIFFADWAENYLQATPGLNPVIHEHLKHFKKKLSERVQPGITL